MGLKVFSFMARFEGANSDENFAKGYLNNTFYHIKVRQDGEKFKVKRTLDTNNTGVKIYEDFDSFTTDWCILRKYL